MFKRHAVTDNEENYPLIKFKMGVFFAREGCYCFSFFCVFHKRHLVLLHKGEVEEIRIRRKNSHQSRIRTPRFSPKDAEGREGGIVKEVCPTFLSF